MYFGTRRRDVRDRNRSAGKHRTIIHFKSYYVANKLQTIKYAAFGESCPLNMLLLNKQKHSYEFKVD